MIGSIHEMLEFGSDVDIRRHFFVEESFVHSAKLHLRLLQWILDRYVPIGAIVLDPMAGSGSILLAATQQRNVIAYEVEPRWIHILRENAAYISERAGLFPGDIIVEQRDARQPWKHTANVVLFSPPYGNEASSGPLAHRALIYKQLEGRRWKSLLARAEQQHGSYGSMMFHYGTHPQQIGHFRGERYWQAMQRVYAQAYQSLRPDGFLILIVKDHIAQAKRVPTVATTRMVCEELGFQLVAHHQRHLSQLSLWQRRRKERGEPVIEEEDILVFRKGAQS
jgi:DNA modification methylase